MAASWATAFWLPAMAASALADACLAIFTSELACASWILQPVVLLAERVDFIRQLRRLGDQLFE